jgi:hypothetical protein
MKHKFLVLGKIFICIRCEGLRTQNPPYSSQRRFSFLETMAMQGMANGLAEGVEL